MKPVMTRSFGAACALALVAAGGTVAVAKDPPKLDGTYKITAAKLPDGKKYVGTITVAAHGDAYDVAWATGSDGATHASGSGRLLGKRFAVAFGGATEGAGVISHCEVDGSKGSVCGDFTGDEAHGGLASLSSMDGDAKRWEGTYQQGSDAGGDSTVTEFTITKVKGTIYALTFTWADGHTLHGVGLDADKQLYVAWGEDAGLVLYKVSGKVLDGTWAAPGAAAVGSEKATR
jgi:predicted heme/steroid binding protein